tara:strand:+ start:723 stop:1049 length:327 start_codon:yes stop_codon:yes gene_type:complete
VIAKKIWTKENLNRANELKNDGLTARQIGDRLGVSKNSVLGMLYRDKVKRGYIPNGKSQVVKNDNIHKSYFKKIGERNCMMCNENFDMYSRFDRFCDRCKRTSMYRSA